jgi:hypothetical protein
MVVVVVVVVLAVLAVLVLVLVLVWGFRDGAVSLEVGESRGAWPSSVVAFRFWGCESSASTANFRGSSFAHRIAPLLPCCISDGRR